ncbi:MAG: ATP-binding protein, partial [Bryobacteraceae bacterium]
ARIGGQFEMARLRRAASERERELRNKAGLRRAQFETLLNNAPLGVYLVDGDFRIRQVNPTALHAFRNIRDLIGRDFDEVIRVLWPTAYADEMVERFRHTLETGEPYFVPERIEERLDLGVREFYEWQIHRIQLPEGHDGVVCYFRDISAQVSARLAAAESGERLRFMAESMPQKIFTATTTGDIDYLNQQWVEFTGLSLERIKNWGWTQFVHPGDVEENVRVWKQSIDTGEPFQFIQRFRRADGVYRWHLSRAQALRDSSGKVSMWIGSNTEIHEQKEIEVELRRANENLSQFAFAAAHDLQEPLRMITSYSQMLLKGYRGQLDGEASVCVDFITAGAKRMRDLLSDLLTYTQVGTTAEREAEPIDLNLVFQTAVQNLAAATNDSGAAIASEPLPKVLGHEAHFVQLFQNLIGNAIKYRGKRSPRIHISAGERTGEWRFAVADNGMGIAPEYHKTIFGVFKRLHGKSIPGTGIGLAICQRVVERYGGRIWIESQLDQGSTFYFTLPVMRGETGDL